MKFVVLTISLIASIAQANSVTHKKSKYDGQWICGDGHSWTIQGSFIQAQGARHQAYFALDPAFPSYIHVLADASGSPKDYGLFTIDFDCVSQARSSSDPYESGSLEIDNRSGRLNGEWVCDHEPWTIKDAFAQAGGAQFPAVFSSVPGRPGRVHAFAQTGGYTEAYNLWSLDADCVREFTGRPSHEPIRRGGIAERPRPSDSDSVTPGVICTFGRCQCSSGVTVGAGQTCN